MEEKSTPPTIKKVEWLIGVLDLDSQKQAYDIIAAKQIPEDCIIRLGRRIRINADAVIRWLSGSGANVAARSPLGELAQGAYCDARR